MFGDEHLGKAIALRRDRRAVTQVELAAKIGVNKSTMNAYERGKRGMDEATLDRIAAVLECDPLEIWEDAFKIFRYNYFAKQAKRMGVTAEELAHRTDPRPSIERLGTGFRAIADTVWTFMVDVLAYLRPDRYYESRNGISMWGVVVKPPAKATRRRAIRFRRGKKATAGTEPTPHGD